MKHETLHILVRTHFTRAHGWQETTRGGTTNCTWDKTKLQCSASAMGHPSAPRRAQQRLQAAQANRWASPDRGRCNSHGSYAYTSTQILATIVLKISGSQKDRQKFHFKFNCIMTDFLGASQMQIARRRVHLNLLLASAWLCHHPGQVSRHWLLRGSFLWELLTAVCTQKCPFHVQRWPPRSAWGLQAALACAVEWPQLEVYFTIACVRL